jgi:hypothetical protein
MTSAAVRGDSNFELVEVLAHGHRQVWGYIRKVEIFEDHAAEGLL